MKKFDGIVGNFTGIDLRRDAAMSESGSLRTATNVDLLPGGNLRRRHAMVKLCDVSSETVGLYASNGLLRTVCPGGQSLQDTRPAEVWYDPIGDGTAFTLGELSKLHAVEVVSSASGGSSYPYVSVEKTDGRIEHHWLNSDPVDASTAVNTRVKLPFDPGKTLIKSNNKLFADDPSAGVLRFSASTTGPTDWTKQRDAGFLAVRQHSAGSRDIVALTYYKEYVAVVFQDSTQIWLMNADPSKFQFINALNGPGTEASQLTKNVQGDMLYYSRGGFRSLSRSLITGDDQPSQIGAAIYELTKDIDVSDITPIAIWSEARSQYIACFGTTCYVLTHSPSSETVGWTTWELPVSVEYLVENNGVLYARSGNTVYKFDQDAVADTDGAVTYDVLTAFQHYGRPGVKKTWRWLDIVQVGSSLMNFRIDVNSSSEELTYPIQLNNTTFSGGHIAINRVCDSLAIHLTGTGIWRLDSIILDAKILRGRG